MTNDWLDEVATALGVDPLVLTRNDLLLLARDAARGVERKSAPLSTFLVGYAAGKANADRDGVVSIVDQVRVMCPPPREDDD
jgi:hypothetical protein